jgi:hypothetical protein
MKYLIALFMVASVSVFAQTNYRTVMTDTNGVLQRPTNFITTNRIVSVNTNGTVSNPTNFWTANSNSINTIIAPASYFNDRIFNRTIPTFANLLTENINGILQVSNSIIATEISGTNASGKTAIRLVRDVNSRGAAGSGTLFGSDSHFIWVRFEAIPSHGTVRAVLGNNWPSTINIAEYPTSRAIGFELSKSGGSTNQVRLIAHNGTTNTNGSWVNIGTEDQRFWIGVEQNKTNGEVKLYVGLNSAAPTNNTNATIFGGPTNNAGQNLSAFDVGLFTTNTNANSAYFSIYGTFIDVID